MMASHGGNGSSKDRCTSSARAPNRASRVRATASMVSSTSHSSTIVVRVRSSTRSLKLPVPAPKSMTRSGVMAAVAAAAVSSISS